MVPRSLRYAASVLLCALAATAAWGSGGGEEPAVVEHTIRLDDRSEAPILAPVRRFDIREVSGSTTAVPGPVAILGNGRYVLSDIENMTVQLVSEDGDARVLLTYGEGPNEVTYISGVVRRGPDAVTVVSVFGPAKLVTFDASGSLVETEVADLFLQALVPTDDGLVGLSLDDQAVPRVVIASPSGEVRRSVPLQHAVTPDERLRPADANSSFQAYLDVAVTTDGRTVWAVSRWRTRLFKIGGNGTVERCVVVDDEMLPDGTSTNPFVTSEAYFASLSVTVDESGLVFVAVGIGTRADDGGRLSHIDVFTSDGALVGLLRLSGVARAWHISAFEGELLVSPERYGSEVVLYDYSHLVPMWRAMVVEERSEP